ncbi:MAG: 30S ribosome-binding factor RbfA [Coxiella endosymbiont of Dermacentor nuttalli]
MKKFKLNEKLPNQRQQKVADLIHQELAKLLKKEVYDPRLTLISLTAASVSHDLKQAKIFYTLLEDQNLREVQKVLDKATGYLQHLLTEVTVLRYIPKLQFAHDESIERTDKVLLLIKQAIQDDNQVKK